MTLTKAQLAAVLDQHGVRTIKSLAVDEVYALPSERWLRDTFCEALGEFLYAVGADQAEREIGDCDDFARLACAYAGLLHRRSAPAKFRNNAIAVGEFFYRSEKTGGGHAICAAIVGSDTRLPGGRLVFIEPQRPMLIGLSKKEVESCFAWRF